MRLCRFNDDRLGLVADGAVRDVTAALDRLPQRRWPLPPGDQLVASLGELRPHIEQAAAGKPRIPLAEVVLKSPVANPNKIIGAPVNYRDHHEEAIRDPNLSFGQEIPPIEKLGLFLKANSGLVGAGEGVQLRFPDRRSDHEVELVAVIGRQGTRIGRADALAHVAGYAVGLDMTVRGTEDRGFRKSIDSYAVLGPWLVTTDEIADPNALDLALTVNGEPRQSSNTRWLIYDVQKLIELASAYCTLYPGDLIYTGTPAGVGPVGAGDEIRARVEGVGEMVVRVRA